MHEIKWSKNAFEQLNKLNLFIKKRIFKKINELSSRFPKGNIKKLVNSKFYRLRVGDYRVIFSADNLLKILKIVKIGHRKNIYKEF